ncbi:MAG: iron ABC transporter permease [Methylococcales bacterium]|jgi:iron complex transport system permease protein|nr:iron ABC transporter permease [Methylococcales bacterium]MBT7408622.1 iron ABC transporter permease [Methylococcales bacterium]
MNHAVSKVLISFVLILIPIISIIVSLVSGIIEITWSELFSLSNSSDSLSYKIIVDVRLPRTICAFAVGGMLSMAGAIMQTLIRNPLADPYILGISGGASIGAILAILLGFSSFWVPLGAMSGSLVSMMIIFLLISQLSSFSSTHLLLYGVVLAMGWNAIISFILTISPADSLHNMLFWMMGDLNYAQSPSLAIFLLLVGLLLILPFTKILNILNLGNEQAMVLGVNINKMSLYLLLIASFLTATSVTIAGSIGFVGLIVPHMIRLTLGYNHTVLIPASISIGGSLIVIADTIARTAFSPLQLPVGVVTAFIGVPVFLLLLVKNNQVVK